MADSDKEIIEKVKKAMAGKDWMSIGEAGDKMKVAHSTAAKYLLLAEGKGLVEKNLSKLPRKEYRWKGTPAKEKEG
jgi:ribosomal protein S25